MGKTNEYRNELSTYLKVYILLECFFQIEQIRLYNWVFYIMHYTLNKQTKACRFQCAKSSQYLINDPINWEALLGFESMIYKSHK